MTTMTFLRSHNSAAHQSGNHPTSARCCHVLGMRLSRPRRFEKAASSRPSSSHQIDVCELTNVSNPDPKGKSTRDQSDIIPRCAVGGPLCLELLVQGQPSLPHTIAAYWCLACIQGLPSGYICAPASERSSIENSGTLRLRSHRQRAPRTVRGNIPCVQTPMPQGVSSSAAWSAATSALLKIQRC